MINYISDRTKVFLDQNPNWINPKFEDLITVKNVVDKKKISTEKLKMKLYLEI